ncbi:hypothetical protein [Bacillus piscicola]|uniref:hypothetical protein n=1 Tax=Bacillus piscicola TaxID=1632684 RepID=UPI001F08E179|nr:hypothetical protein [Bacillus piscicola]
MSEALLQQILIEMKTMKDDIAVIKSEQTSMKDDIALIKSEQTSMKDDITLIKVQLNENTDLTRAIRDRQEETNAKLEALSMDTHQLHGDIVSLKANESRQDKILESLAARSLEQETDLRDLKRAR